MERDKIEKVGTERKVALFLGKEVKGMGNEVMVEVDKCIMCWLVKCWQRMKGLVHDFPNHTTARGSTTYVLLHIFTN